MNPPSPTLASLFDNPSRPPVPGAPRKPSWQWGMRGDPHLWYAMRERFADSPWPASVAALDELLATTFEAFTGEPLATKDPIFVQHFAHGGMTSGYIAPTWWREQAIPFLRERYLAANHAPS